MEAEVKKVTKGYEEQPVLLDCSLKIQKGEILIGGRKEACVGVFRRNKTTSGHC